MRETKYNFLYVIYLSISFTPIIFALIFTSFQLDYPLNIEDFILLIIAVPISGVFIILIMIRSPYKIERNESRYGIYYLLKTIEIEKSNIKDIKQIHDKLTVIIDNNGNDIVIEPSTKYLQNFIVDDFLASRY